MDEHKFQCFVCQKVLELATAGQSSLTDHAKGKNHTDSLGKGNSFFKHVKVKQVETEVSGSSYETKAVPFEQQTLEGCLCGSDTIKSEFLWMLNSVTCGYSAGNSDNLDKVFSVMFIVSKIAQNFFLD